MPRVGLRERHLAGALDARHASLQIDPPRCAEHVQMADARVDAEPLARRRTPVRDSTSMAFRSSTVTRVGTTAGLVVDTRGARISTDLKRPSAPMRCWVCSIALRRNRSPGDVRQPPADDAIVDAPVAGDVDGAEKSDRAGLGAHDHARPHAGRSARARCRPAHMGGRGSEESRPHARPPPFPPLQ